MESSAIVVLVFNRPETTVRLIDRLALVRPKRLLVVADGPRANRPGEVEKVAAVRALFERLPWSCSVERDFADTNLGCRRRVSSGLSWAFSLVEEAIVLEDDCLPHPSFFPFCAELLARYRDDRRIGSISGTDFTVDHRRPEASYWFSRYNLFWGWATWRRAWHHYDDMMGPMDRRADAVDGVEAILRRTFPRLRERLYWRFILRRTHSSRIESWGYRWMLSCWAHGLLGIQPAVSMIDNVGTGADATHTRYNPYGLRPAEAMDDPLRHPMAVQRDEARDRAIEDRIYSRSPGQRLRWLWRKLTQR